MILFGNFVIIALPIFGVTSIVAIFFLLRPSRKSRKIIGMVSLAVCIVAFICVAIVGAVFSGKFILNIEPVKIYSEPKIVSSTNYELSTLGNASYYLVQEDNEYLYLIVGNSKINKKPLRVNISQCKVAYNDDEPKLVVQKIENEYRSEWLLFYDHGIETETKYEFNIPDENNILNLDDL